MFFCHVCDLAVQKGFKSSELTTGKSILLRNINTTKLDTNETTPSKSRLRKNQSTRLILTEINTKTLKKWQGWIKCPSLQSFFEGSEHSPCFYFQLRRGRAARADRKSISVKPLRHRTLTELLANVPTSLGQGDVSRISTPLKFGAASREVFSSATSLALKLWAGARCCCASVPLR